MSLDWITNENWDCQNGEGVNEVICQGGSQYLMGPENPKTVDLTDPGGGEILKPPPPPLCTPLKMDDLRIRNLPFVVYNRFSGLRSLCAIFRSWRNFTATQISFTISAASKYTNSLTIIFYVLHCQALQTEEKTTRILNRKFA